MNVDIKVDADRVIAAFKDRSTRVTQALKDVVARTTADLYLKVFLRTPVRSGALQEHITTDYVGNDLQAIGRVFVAPGLPYAAIQEYGGQTSPHDIYPVNASVLAWAGADGGMVFAKYVHHPGSKIPAKNYLHGPFEEMKAEIQARIEAAIVEQAKAA